MDSGNARGIYMSLDAWNLYESITFLAVYVADILIICRTAEKYEEN